MKLHATKLVICQENTRHPESFVSQSFNYMRPGGEKSPSYLVSLLCVQKKEPVYEVGTYATELQKSRLQFFFSFLTPNMH